MPDEDEVNQGYDSEGQIGPFNINYGDDGEDEEDDLPCTDAVQDTSEDLRNRNIDYDQLKLVELKEMLKELKLKVTGRKSDLIARLKEAQEKGLTPETIAAALPAGSNQPKTCWKALALEEEPIDMPKN